jgi:hypothetical protein
MKKFHNLFALTLTLLLLSFSPCQSQSWNQIGNDIDGEAEGDESGTSVSLSSDGQTMAIGAISNDGNGSNSGHVRIYTWSGSAWTQVGNDIDGEYEGDESGCSVSLSGDGNTVAIGAADYSYDRGHVRIYTWSGSSWTQLGQDIIGESTYDESGYSVSLSGDGNTVAIGAPGDDGNAGFSNDDRGHVRIYNWNGSAWTQVGNDIDGEAEGDESGNAVSLSSDGQTVAIGAIRNDGQVSHSNRGHVRIYSWNGSAWTQLGQDINGEDDGDYNGRSVSLSSDGQTVAIGATSNDGNGSNSGHVRIYYRSGSAWAWTQVGNDIHGEAEGDYSGRVSLSNDGQTVAIGAISNDGNGSNSGHVRIYTWSGSVWAQIGLDIDGEAVADESGFSLSLSSDGQTVAIGAAGNDGNGLVAGHVRVFEFGLVSGVNEEDLVNEIQLHPNPSSGIFTVNVPDQSNIQASVFDALGKLVSTSNEIGTFNLDLSEVPVGIYTLRLDTESGTVTKKLVRE